jgi:LPXTG-motif cell wall-anchored protein
MYTNATLAGAGGAGAALGALPATGLDLIWFVIAAFALLMAAGALWRIVPRREG